MIQIRVKKESRISKLVDLIMMPFMYLISGTLESPQKTHFWNNKKLNRENIESLDQEKMVQSEGIADAVKKGIVLFHIPIFGGWKDYIVLEPEEKNIPWHVGWITKDYAGITQIIITGPVRMLLGRDDVSFFGIRTDTNTQIHIRKIGEGKIGDGGIYKKVPLL